jgi:hypothetical protein
VNHLFKNKKNQERLIERPRNITTTSNGNNTTIDCGYYSIPTTDVSLHNRNLSMNDDDNNDSLCGYSSSSMSSLSSLDQYQTIDFTSFVDLVQQDIEEFLFKMQDSIEIYVRPLINSNIVSRQECLFLYQNIEKLIPVTKYLLNMFTSLKTLKTDRTSSSFNTNSNDMLNIVFDTFKIYLNGLSKALLLLDSLTRRNDYFISFIEKLNGERDDETCFKIFDFLFLPMDFAQVMLSHMIRLRTFVPQSQKAAAIVNELKACKFLKLT